MTLIALALKVILAVYYCKNAARKTRQIYQYYNTIVEYGVFAKKATYFSALLITLEYMIAITLVLHYHDVLYLLIGMLLHFIYLTMQVIGSGKSVNPSCNCFEHSLPKTISLKSILIQLILLFFLITLYGISIRL